MKKISRLLGLLCSTALLLAGCSDVSSDSSDSTTASSSKESYVKIGFDSSISRTALPAYTLSDFDEFSLYVSDDFTDNDDAVCPAPLTETGWTCIQGGMSYEEISSSTILVEPGAYFFKLRAVEYDVLHNESSATVVHSFVGVTNEKVTVGEGLNNISISKFSFSFLPGDYGIEYGGGSGSFSVQLAFPSVVETVEAALYSFDANTLEIGTTEVSGYEEEALARTSGNVVYNGSSYDSVVYAKKSVPSGYYIARFTLSWGASTLDYDELVIVANGKSSVVECSTTTGRNIVTDVSVSIADLIIDAPASVGDIVLSDGTAINGSVFAASSSLNADDFSEYFTNGAGSSIAPVGVVFYMGYPSDGTAASANQRALGNRVLCVGLKNSIADKTSTMVWALNDKNETAKGFANELKTIAVYDRESNIKANSLRYTYDDVIYSGWHTNKGSVSNSDWFNPLFDGCTAFDKLVAAISDATDTGTVDAPEDTYPAFKYAIEELKDTILKTKFNATGASDVTLSGWETDAKFYLPSVIELLELYQNIDAVNAVLSKTEGCYGKNSVNTLTGTRYWSSSQYATCDTEAWSVGFADGAYNAGKTEHSSKTSEYCVCGVIEYSVAD